MNWLTTQPLAIGGSGVTFASFLVALLVLAIGFLVASQLGRRIRSLSTESEDARRWQAMLARVVSYGLRLAALAVALQVAGIDIASVLAAGAVLAVGIGIALQKVAENFVSGIILFAERSIKEGDIIQFEGGIARVERIGIRATIALTLDEEEIIVPNSVLVQSAVKNLTHTEVLHRLRVTVGVAYETDIDRAFEVLRAAATSVAWRDPGRAPVVLLTDFGSSSIDFEVSVWTRDVWGLRRGQSSLRHTLWRALKDAGITIPFTQVDLHFPPAGPPPSLPPGA